MDGTAAPLVHRIVIMGGDGSYNEAISGLLIRHMTEAKRDVNDSGSDFIPTSVPLGFIPTGKIATYFAEN